MSLRLTGVKEIDEVLRGLPLQVADKILAQTFTEAAKPMVEAIQRYTPTGETDNLINSIGSEKEKYYPESVGTIVVGPRRKGRYKGFIAAIINDGTVKRQTESGANRGVGPAFHFMDKGYAEEGAKTISRIDDIQGKKIYNFMRRTIKNS